MNKSNVNVNGDHKPRSRWWDERSQNNVDIDVNAKACISHTVAKRAIEDILGSFKLIFPQVFGLEIITHDHATMLVHRRFKGGYYAYSHSMPLIRIERLSGDVTLYLLNGNQIYNVNCRDESLTHIINKWLCDPRLDDTVEGR